MHMSAALIYNLIKWMLDVELRKVSHGASTNGRSATNGTLAALDTSITVPTAAATRLDIGYQYFNGNSTGSQMNGYMKRLTFIPACEPDLTLGDYSR